MGKWNPIVYDKKFFIQCCVGLGLMALAMKLSGGLAFLAIFPLLLIGFGRNKTEFLFYLLLMDIAMTMANGNIVPKGAIFGYAARSVHFLIAGVMVLQMTGQRISKLLSPMMSVFFYIGYMALISAQGWMPLISYLKMTLFGVMFLGFFSVANAATMRQLVDGRKIRSVMLSFSFFFIMGSMALLPFPGIATLGADYYTSHGMAIPEGSFFTGMTLHSQALGPVVSALATLLFADVLFSVQRWDKLYVLLLICCPILIYKTGSRTAMGAYLAGVLFVSFLFVQGRGVMARWKQRAVSLLTVIGIVGTLLMATTPQMREAVARFALKYASEGQELDVSFEELTKTRQGSVDTQMENFHAKPWTGNGFQVSKSMDGMDVYSINQVMSAPVEKGVWITAVLEEGGVFGEIVFVLCVIIAFFSLLSRGAYIGLAVFFSMIVSNLGEFSMFSMTSTGGLVWATVFIGLALDGHRQKTMCHRWSPQVF